LCKQTADGTPSRPCSKAQKRYAPPMTECSNKIKRMKTTKQNTLTQLLSDRLSRQDFAQFEQTKYNLKTIK
jgi:hypothetical protein